MRAIKLMPDYQCFALWEASPDRVGNINPEDLPISGDLKVQLAMWAKAYDATLSVDDPIFSAFQSEAAEVEFREAGEQLSERLRGELGADFTVELKVL